MVAEISVRGAEKLRALSRALNEAAEKDLRRELYRRMSRAVAPLTEKVKGSLPRFLPDRYADELSRTLKFRTTRRLDRSKNPGVSLWATASTPRGKPRNLAALNRGRLRHPLYGDRRHWFNQPVTPGFWDKPLEDSADEVRRELVNVLDDIGRELARKVKG